jgi:hypothetical protein
MRIHLMGDASRIVDGAGEISEGQSAGQAQLSDGKGVKIYFFNGVVK